MLHTFGNSSPAAWIASLPATERSRFLHSLTEKETELALWEWWLWARPNQLPPAGQWRTWLLLAGRGFGKTRTGAEWVRGQVESGRRGRLALVAPTAADVRDVVVEGESGILAVSPPWFRPTYEPSKRRLTWPNGAMATTYSADEPERLRGPQHDGAWCDECGVWRYPEAFDMLMFGLRLGEDPRVVVTATPKPVRLVRELLQAPTTAVTRGTTYDNRPNLPEAFFQGIIRKYEGTRLGRQELNAELLEDMPGALWRRDTMLDALRVTRAPEMQRVVVALDPSINDDEEESAAEAGIVVAGLGVDGQGYVLDDRSRRTSPQGWATEAIAAYRTHRADRIVAEENQGGTMVALTLRTLDPGISYKGVHASRGKQARAEPVAALYEQGRVHHVGFYPDLEDQLCNWVPGNPSPDRLDALVWALTELMLGAGQTWIL